MKINLILPRLQDSANRFFARSKYSDIVRHWLRMGKTNHIPPLSLMYIAAVTPNDIDINIIDERFENIDYNKNVDLVGISVVTRSANRAYHLAKKYRQRGVKVVLGGIHPSVMTNEALQYADSVVQGEGEAIWPKLLNDFKMGNLKQIYKNKSPVLFNELPFPRRDIFKPHYKYLTEKVLTATRGCPRSCIFCSVGSSMGKKYRTRDINNVISEIKSISGNIIYFADENLGVDIEYAKNLFNALIPLRIKWYGEIELLALEDQELIDLIRQSGCVSLQMGFDSLNTNTINYVKKRKTNKPSEYKEICRRLHEAGIVIAGSFIIGFDTDTNDVFKNLIDFIDECNIEMPSINSLIPYPGTKIFDQYEKEGRLLHKNWDYYDTAAGFVVYSPKNFTERELADGYFSVSNTVHSPKASIKRILKAKTRNTIGKVLAFHYNQQKLKSVREEMYKINLDLSKISPKNN